MELDVRRLRDSRFAASADGEAFRAAILLWCAAWHQTPASSLPDDDIELANLAGYGRVVKEWRKVRAEALHGFIKCSDGRLYHPVIADKAVSAYAAKERHAYGKFCDRMRKENVKRTHEKKPPVGIPSLEQWKSGAYPNGILPDSENIPPESKPLSTGIPAENPLRGNREGTEREQNGEGTINYSLPNGKGAEAPSPGLAKSPDQMTKTELWAVGKSILFEAGTPVAQCGTVVGKLCKDYGDEIVIEALRTAAVQRPVDPIAFLKATCQTLVGERKRKTPWWTSDELILAEGSKHKLAPYPGENMATFKARVQAAIDGPDVTPAQPPPKVVTPTIIAEPEVKRDMTPAAKESRSQALKAALKMKRASIPGDLGVEYSLESE
ncbi:DUF1376 domain-containing protein [Undibacterium sp. NL8W]|uniref:DUF1376 domain-containing protein n=2 Tax=Undibacterium umbellatum TaxID=2762300 RepID=A0ABR6Z3N3_9BURK|nr:DUF1376 domain-containing protein [Undibacterium umbellatum]